MYVTGIGRTKFGISNKTISELAYVAMVKALEDSNTSIKSIDAIYISNFVSGPSQNQLHLNSVISSLLPELKIPIITIEAACAAGGSALYQALISLSRFKNVMVLGIEKMTGVNNMINTKNVAMAGDRIIDQNEGLIFPASYSLCAQQHMLKYGTTLDDLALISLKNHNNANLNSLSHFYYKSVNLEMIKNSPIVCSPLRLFDCCPLSDGAAALIISKNKEKDGDVEIIASSMATDCISLAQRKDITSFMATKKAAKEAYKQARIKSNDVDVAEVHDCFTIAELIAMEDLGFCKAGESKHFIRDERTSLHGDIPINTNGGLKADGHPIGATGVAQIIEIVTQLRGKAGKRQVDNAEIGLTHNIGGVGGTAVIHILKKESENR